MTLARFKDLCLDTNDTTLLGPFWRQALGAALVNLDDGDARLDPGPGRPANEILWINVVPEPRTVKTRVHLDLRLAEPEPAALVDAGAQVVRPPGEDHWWVLADPEGNELCAFPPDGPERPGLFELCVDSAEPLTQAQWWTTLVGGTIHQWKNFAWIEGAAGFPWEMWLFNAVPEGKIDEPRTGRRIHLDLMPTDRTRDEEIERLKGLGATEYEDHRKPDGAGWMTMADPEGNLFCVERSAAERV